MYSVHGVGVGYKYVRAVLCCCVVPFLHVKKKKLKYGIDVILN